MIDLLSSLGWCKPHWAQEKALAAQPDWLKRVNYFRSQSNVLSAVEDQKLSDGDFKHSRYLAKFWLRNHASPPGAEAHSEEKDDPWYSAEGYEAARTTGNVIPYLYGNLAGDAAVDSWISGPFHRVAILESDHGIFGYGQFCESAICTAALSARSSPSLPKGAPVMFPGNGAEVRLATYSGGEWPDPLSSCPGYKAPVGLPITLQLDSAAPTRLSSYRVTRSGGEVEACGFDALSYKNGDPFIQQYARNILAAYRAIVIVPRTPFETGGGYGVSIFVDGRSYSWHFSVR